MPYGKGTYGGQVGRPSAETKKKLMKDPDIRKLAMKKMAKMKKK